MSTFGTTIAYALEIEGVSKILCTDPALERVLADGREYVAGMITDGMTIEEEIDPVYATVEASDLTITVVDTWHSDAWTDFFVSQPTSFSWVTDAIAIGDTNVNVMATSPFTAGDKVFVGSETLEIDSITNSTQMVCSRAAWGSIEQAHFVGVGAELTYPLISTRPLGLIGRRAKLSRWTDVDDPQADGTQIWLGVISTDAQLSPEGTAFSFGVAPVSSLLDVDLGSDKDGTYSVRGISYLAQPFSGFVFETDSADYVGVSGGDPTRFARIQLPRPGASIGGVFYETQTDWADALAEEVAEAMDNTGSRPDEFQYDSASTLGSSSRGEAVSIFADEEIGVWGYRFRAGGTPRWLIIRPNLDNTQLVEGAILPSSVGDGSDAYAPVINGDVRDHRAGLGVPGAAKVPRGIIGWGGDAPEATDESVLATDSWPGTFYLDSFAVAAVGDAVTIKHGDRLVGTFTVGDYDASDQRLAIRETFSPPIVFTAANPPQLTIHRRFVKSGSVADLVRRLCEESPSVANLGGMPLLVGSVDFTVDYDAESNGPFTTSFSGVSGGFTVRFGNGAVGWIVSGVDNGTTGTLNVALIRGQLPSDNDTISQLKSGGGEVTALCDGDASEVTSGDIAGWGKIAWEAAEGRGFLLSRKYQSSSAVNLLELLSHELRLLGCFMRMEASGRLTIQQARLPSATQRADWEVDATRLVTGEAPPSWQRQALGSLGSVEIKSGYDPVEDKHIGNTYLVRDVSAFSRNKKAIKLEVHPKSSTGALPELSPEQASDIGQRLLSLYGRPYSTIQIEVDSRYMSTALCGSIGKITTHRVPSVFTGARGIERLRGLVVARSWDLARGRGLITLVTSDVDLAGYTPSAWIESSAVVSGNQYDLELSFNKFGTADSLMPPGGALSEFYEAGYLLSVWEWDASSQTAQKCGVDSVTDSTNTIRVTFTSSPTLTGTRYVTFSKSDEPGMEDTTQRIYAFVSDSSGFVDFGGAEQDNAKVYS